ncbi:MAG: LysR family transcriptional regulator [Beijerinckiaceae bacterium]|nr:LysR family transcriptional regulator [Beijerinckiaceae bacterium]
MTEPGTPTLDQLRVFLAVAEAETLAGAGRKLGRATSAISYAIDNLEAQLGIKLFDRETTRKPRLTEAGRAVAAEACGLSRGFDKLRARVKGLSEGLEAEMALVVDVMLPTYQLVDALRAFQTMFPTVPVRLHIEALGAVRQRVLDGAATLGISGPFAGRHPGLETLPLKGVELIPVAAPDHPLAAPGRHEPGALRDHIQLVLTDRSSLTAGQDFGVHSEKTWRLADLGAKHGLLLAGVGWGNMPLHMVRADLAAGRLVALDFPDWKGATFPLLIIYASHAPPGPAGRWLIERFAGYK